MLGYTAAEVDELSVRDFLLLTDHLDNLRGPEGGVTS